jgi:hypothetical protein
MQRADSVNTVVLIVLSLSCVFAQEAEPASRVYTQSSKSVFLIILKSVSGDLVGQATGFSITGNRIVTNEHVVERLTLTSERSGWA